ncbi:hypothetical protein ACFLX2_00065 [Candidatus Dependentiae bacterium]
MKSTKVRFLSIIFGLFFGFTQLSAYVYRAEQLVDETENTDPDTNNPDRFEVNLFYDLHLPFEVIANIMFHCNNLTTEDQINFPNMGVEEQARNAAALAKNSNARVLIENCLSDKNQYLYAVLRECENNGIDIRSWEGAREYFFNQLSWLMATQTTGNCSEEDVFDLVMSAGASFEELSREIEHWRDEDGPQASQYYDETLNNLSENLFVKLWQENEHDQAAIIEKILEFATPHLLDTTAQNAESNNSGPANPNPETPGHALKNLLAQENPINTFGFLLDVEFVHEILKARREGVTTIDIHAGGAHGNNIKELLTKWGFTKKASRDSHWNHNDMKTGDIQNQAVQEWNQDFEKNNIDINDITPITIDNHLFEQDEVTQVHTETESYRMYKEADEQANRQEQNLKQLKQPDINCATETYKLLI